MSSEHCKRVNPFSIDPSPCGTDGVVRKVVLAALGENPRCFFEPSTKAPSQCPCTQPYGFSFVFPTLGRDVKVLAQPLWPKHEVPLFFSLLAFVPTGIVFVCVFLVHS